MDMTLTPLAEVPREPTAEDIENARMLVENGRAVLAAGRLAEMRRRRAEARAARPVKRRYSMATHRCGWCSVTFRARVVPGPVAGRWCSNSCRQMGYRARKARIKRRDAARAAILAAAGLV